MFNKKNLLVLIFIGSFTLAFADKAPVVDYSTQDEQAAKPVVKVVSDEGQATASGVEEAPAITESHSDLSTEQRVSKIEQQIANLNQQGLANKIDDLQQRLQKLNGTVEDQGHEIAQLNDQLRDFYQDLNQRIGSGSAAVKKDVGAAKKKANQSAKESVVSDRASLKEQQLYQTAVDLLPSAESAKKLRDYVKDYPNGAYVPGAHYWLGEVYFSQKNFTASEAEFKTVLNNYPKSPKISDAMLKIALIHDNQNKHEQAKLELQQVIKRFPGSQAAKLAKQQIDAM